MLRRLALASFLAAFLIAPPLALAQDEKEGKDQKDPVAKDAKDQKDQAAKDAEADEALVKKAKNDATVLLRKLGDAKAPKQHDELVSQVEALDVRGQVLAVVDGVKQQKKPAVRQYCIKRLVDMNVVQAVPHLVIAATSDADEAVRTDAQAAARDLDPDFARRWYEHVAIQDVPHRTHALEGIATLGTRAAAAIPLLAGMMDVTRTTEVGNMSVVGIDVRATLAGLLATRSIGVNLGSNNSAATQVPIELPELSINEVHSTVNVPVATMTPWRDTARSSLRAVSGFDLGPDSDAWRDWWKKNKEGIEKGQWKAPTYTPSSRPDSVEHALSVFPSRDKDAQAWNDAKDKLVEGGKETLRKLLAIAADEKRATLAYSVLRAVTGELIPDDAAAWKAYIDSKK